MNHVFAFSSHLSYWRYSGRQNRYFLIEGYNWLCVDVLSAAVLPVVYLTLGITHAVFFFRLSKKRFIPQAMVMGFCFSRVVTMCLRISWTTNICNKNIAIAANVFVIAGVLLIVSTHL